MVDNSNRPDGYPNDPAFDAAAKKALDKRKTDLEQAESFLKALNDSLRQRKD